MRCSCSSAPKDPAPSQVSYQMGEELGHGMSIRTKPATAPATDVAEVWIPLAEDQRANGSWTTSRSRSRTVCR